MWGLLAAQLMQGIFNMYGAHKQGKAEAAMYGFQARQDEENARAVALENSIAEDNLRKQNRKQLGELEARQAETGYPAALLTACLAIVPLIWSKMLLICAIRA